MRCNFLVLCEYAARLDTGGPILMGLIRELQPPFLPIQLNPFYVASELEVDPHEADQTYELQLRMIDQDGRIYYQQEIEVEFYRRPKMRSSYAYFAGQIRVEQLIEQPGDYRFDLVHGEHVLHSTVFIVHELGETD